MKEREKEAALEEIARYIEEMEVRRKAIGGWDEEDVMRHIRAISEKYETVIREMSAEYEKRSQSLIGSLSQIREYQIHMEEKARREAREILEEARGREKAVEEEIAALRGSLEKEEEAYREKRERLKAQGKEYVLRAREILKEIEELENEEG